MRSAISRLAALSFSLALAGCGEDAAEVTASPMAALTQLSAAPGDRPIQGTCTSAYELYDVVFLPPPNQDIAASARIHQEGSCQLAHLGRVTLVDEQVINFTVVPGALTGRAVLTAANGDELYASEVSSVDPPAHDPYVQGRGTWTWTGGTGRFAGASGKAPWTSVVNLDELTAAVALNGRISYSLTVDR